MSDVMERLRSLADLFEAADAPRHLVLHMRAGADEIERLRAGGCARDQSTTQFCQEAAKKDAEIASLLNALADARTESMKLRAHLCAANSDLTNALTDRTHDLNQIEQNTEYIKRLRAALEPLACTCDCANGEACSRAEVNCAFWNARAALEGK